MDLGKVHLQLGVGIEGSPGVEDPETPDAVVGQGSCV